MGRLLALALILLALPVLADDVRVIDGDTIKANGTTYRLAGIDAPELGQMCGTYPAGKRARAYLAGLILGRSIACKPQSTDRYGRTIATCTADGHDLGADMVEAGHARAYIRYSQAYAGLETMAKLSQRGIHARGCVPPWEYRAAQRSH